MTPTLLQRILLDDFDAKKNDGTYTIEAQRKCAILVEHAQGILQVNDVLAVTLNDELLVIRTDDETLYVSSASIFGIKGAAPDQVTQRPGFRRA